MIKTDEGIADAVQLAVRRALVLEQVTSTLDAGRIMARRLGVADGLFDLIVASVSEKYAKRLLETAGTSGDNGLDGAVERFLSSRRDLALLDIDASQVLEASDALRDSVDEDGSITGLCNRLREQIMAQMMPLSSDNDQSDEVAELRAEIERLENRIAETELNLLQRIAFEDVSGSSAELQTARVIPVRVYVEADIVPEARVIRALNRILDEVDFQGANP